MSNGQVITIGSEAAFDTLLSRAASLPIFVDFTASWCGPCKVMSPIFDSLAKEHPKAVFLKIDVDDQKELARRYGVTAMPTFVALRDKAQVEAIKGADPGGLKSFVAKHAA